MWISSRGRESRNKYPIGPSRRCKRSGRGTIDPWRDDLFMPLKPATRVASLYPWARLAVSLALMTVSGCSMYAVVVVLPAVQAEFGVARADASLPYSLTMIGFGVGGLFMGRLADRFGVMVPVLIGALSLGLGFAAAAMAGSIWT